MELHTKDSFLPRSAGVWCYEAAEVGIKPGEQPPAEIELVHGHARWTYRLADIERTYGGDVFAWTFRCPADPGHVVRIFND